MEMFCVMCWWKNTVSLETIYNLAGHWEEQLTSRVRECLPSRDHGEEVSPGQGHWQVGEDLALLTDPEGLWLPRLWAPFSWLLLEKPQTCHIDDLRTKGKVAMQDSVW